MSETPTPEAAIARGISAVNARHADAALGTLSSEAGAFGAALAGLGFGEFVDGTTWSSVYYRSESADGLLRVICYPQDGDRVVVIGWDPARPAAKLEAWRMEFSGSTPQSIVLAAIANALGVLPITRDDRPAHTCPVCPWTSGDLTGAEATDAAHAHAATPHAPKVAFTI